MYPRKLITAPTSEPVSLAEARAHLQDPPQQDDAMISTLITVARQYIEEVASIRFMTQTWDIFLEEFPDDEDIDLPFAPLQSVTYLKYTDSANTQYTFSSSLYHVDTAHEPGEITLAYGEQWPTVTLKTSNPIVVRAVFGYASASDVPAPLRQAMLLLIEHYYTNRGLVVISDRAGARDVEIPFTVSALIAPYRLWV